MTGPPAAFLDCHADPLPTAPQAYEAAEEGLLAEKSAGRRRTAGVPHLSGWNFGGCRIGKENNAGWVNLENLSARRQIG